MFLAAAVPIASSAACCWACVSLGSVLPTVMVMARPPFRMSSSEPGRQRHDRGE